MGITVINAPANEVRRCVLQSHALSNAVIYAVVILCPHQEPYIEIEEGVEP